MQRPNRLPAPLETARVLIDLGARVVIPLLALLWPRGH